MAQLRSLKCVTEMAEAAAVFLRRQNAPVDENVVLLNAMVADIVADRAITRVADVVERYALSERRLQRLFSEYVGISPKWVIHRYRLTKRRTRRRGRRVSIGRPGPRARLLRPGALHPRLSGHRWPTASRLRQERAAGTAVRRIDVHERRARLGFDIAWPPRPGRTRPYRSRTVWWRSTRPIQPRYIWQRRRGCASRASRRSSARCTTSVPWCACLACGGPCSWYRPSFAPVVQEACTREIAARQRRLYADLFGRAGFTDDIEAWLMDVEASTLRALKARGEATATQLAEDEPRLRQQVLLAEGKAYEAVQNLSTRVLFLLAADGKIVRGRPRGSWISSQYRWSATEVWLPVGCPTYRRLTRRSSWCAAGWRRLVPARGATCSGGAG